MEQQFYQKLENALRAIDVDPEKVGELKPDTHILTIIKPSKFLPFLGRVGIRAEDYIGEAASLRFNDFSDIRLNQDGARRIQEIGRTYRDMPRADQLTNLGLKNMRDLYLELRFSDLIAIGVYESSRRAA